MSRRTERVNDLLEEEISELIQRDLNDPRLSGLVSVTQVEVSTDLRHAKVFISVLGTEEEHDATFAALRAAGPFLQRQLRKRLTIRYVPELDFVRDDSIERGARILDLLRQAQPDQPD